jgi:hypothetical protein
MESDNLKSSSKPIIADGNSLGNAPVRLGACRKQPWRRMAWGRVFKKTLLWERVGVLRHVFVLLLHKKYHKSKITLPSRFR